MASSNTERQRKVVQQIRTDRDLSPHVTGLLFDESFFGHIVRHINFSATDKLDTAGVYVKDGDLFMDWNPDFMSSLNNRQVKGLLKHEVFHLVFQHCTKRSLTPHNVANLAADLAINCAIPKEELPPGGWVPGDVHRDPESGEPDESPVSKLVASLPKHQSMEWYFTKLMDDPEAKKQMTEGGEGSGGGFDDHGGWGDLKPEEAELVKGKLGELLKQAISKADRSNSWGSVPSEMRQQLREMVSNEIDWRAVLRQFVKASKRGTSTSTWTNLHMSNLHEDQGPASPGKKRGFTSNVAVYIDESGSMADEWIAMLLAELANFSRRTTFPMYVFDTEVDEGSKVVWKGRGIPKQALTRARCGGTDFSAPTKHANSGKVKDLDGYLILTDGGAAKPQHSRVRRGYVLAPGQELAFSPDPEDFVIRLKRDAKPE